MVTTNNVIVYLYTIFRKDTISWKVNLPFYFAFILDGIRSKKNYFLVMRVSISACFQPFFFFFLAKEIEDLTQMVISYEIYETSLRRVS